MIHYFFKSKAYLVCFALFCLCRFSYGQKNLVPNYSFENYDSCPSFSNASSPKYWFINCKKNFWAYWYDNSCSSTFGIPYFFFKGDINYQYPRTGDAFVYADWLNGIYDRNYCGTKLSDSLIKGKRYYTEFYVNRPNVISWACNNVGLLFSKVPVFGDTTNFTCGFILTGASVLGYDNPIISDTLGWSKIAGIYTAQGGEQYISIGNFYSKTNTKIISIKPNGVGEAGYLIDDVSVIPLDSFCLKADAGKDTTITLGDSVFIGSFTNGIDSLKWQIQNTNTTIDSTRPGFWVKPTTATTYILQQTVNGCYSADTVVVTVGTVPLKFLKYEVRSTNKINNENNEKQVTNNWVTTNEVNVSHFNVQRSVNGKDFINIGTVKANNKNYNEYSYVDNSPPLEGLGVGYYRIESIGKDGKKQYSTTQQITIKPQTPNGVAIYPNPAKDIVNISGKDGIKQLLITDYLGKKVYQSTVNRQLSTVNNFPKGYT